MRRPWPTGGCGAKNKKEYDSRVRAGLIWLKPGASNTASKIAKELLVTIRGVEIFDHWETTSFSGRTLAYGACAYVYIDTACCHYTTHFYACHLITYIALHCGWQKN